MPTQEEVFEKLQAILTPGVMRSLVKMNLVRDVNVADGKVNVTLASAALASEAQKWLRDRIDLRTEREKIYRTVPER